MAYNSLFQYQTDANGMRSDLTNQIQNYDNYKNLLKQAQDEAFRFKKGSDVTAAYEKIKEGYESVESAAGIALGTKEFPDMLKRAGKYGKKFIDYAKNKLGGNANNDDEEGDEGIDEGMEDDTTGGDIMQDTKDMYQRFRQRALGQDESKEGEEGEEEEGGDEGIEMTEGTDFGGGDEPSGLGGEGGSETRIIEAEDDVSRPINARPGEGAEGQGEGIEMTDRVGGGENQIGRPKLGADEGQEGMDADIGEQTSAETQVVDDDESKIQDADDDIDEGDAEGLEEDVGEDIAEDIGEDVGEDAATEGILQGIGGALDATGILAPLGVLFNVAGFGFAAYQAGKGIADIFEGEDEEKKAKSEVEQKFKPPPAQNLAGSYVVPVRDSLTAAY